MTFRNFIIKDLKGELKKENKTKVLITGGNGFIGSWLVNEFLKRNYDVATFVRPNSKMTTTLDISGASIYMTDIFDSEKLLKKIEPEIVIASDWSGVAFDQRGNVMQMKNVERHLKLARICINLGVQKFITFGSQAEEILQGSGDQKNYYGAAKRELLFELQSAFANSNLTWNWIRLYSIYGPGQSEYNLVSRLISDIKKSKNVQVNHAAQKWNLLHIQDAVNAIYHVAQEIHNINIIPIASQNLVSIGMIAEKINNLIQNGCILTKIEISDPRLNLVNFSPDLSTIKSTGWRERISLECGFQDVLARL